MRLILIAVLSIAGLYSRAQFPMEYFINKSEDAIIIFYADYISKPAKHDSLPRPTSISLDTNPIVIEINPCEATKSIFSCFVDSANFRLEFYYNPIFCNKIIIISSSEDCANSLFEKFLSNTGKLKWTNYSERVKITSVPFRKQEIDGVITYFYLETSIDAGQILLEEKSISKAEWKTFSKSLRN